jgi:hypothetical protein
MLLGQMSSLSPKASLIPSLVTPGEWARLDGFGLIQSCLCFPGPFLLSSVQRLLQFDSSAHSLPRNVGEFQTPNHMKLSGQSYGKLPRRTVTDRNFLLFESCRKLLVYFDKYQNGRGSWIRTNDLQYPKLAFNDSGECRSF